MNDQRINSRDFRINRSALKTALKDINKDSQDPFAHFSSVMYKYFKSKLYLRSDKLDPLILENILSIFSDKFSELAKPISDKRGSEEFRKEVIGVIAKRAEKKAYDRALGNK